MCSEKCQNSFNLIKENIVCGFQALKVQLEDPFALVARSACHLKQGHFQQALDDVNKILKDDAENFKVGVLYYIWDFSFAF